MLLRIAYLGPFPGQTLTTEIASVVRTIARAAIRLFKEHPHKIPHILREHASRDMF